MSNQVSFQFSVNGRKGFEIQSPDGTGKFSASEILKQISEEGAFDGLPKSGARVDCYALKGEGSGNQYVGEDQIDLHDEKEFALVQIGYPFAVNGENFKSEVREITAQRVLEIAHEKGAIPGDPGEYELRLAGGGAAIEFNSIGKIDLAKVHNFITINTSPPTAA